MMSEQKSSTAASQGKKKKSNSTVRSAAATSAEFIVDSDVDAASSNDEVHHIKTKAARESDGQQAKEVLTNRKSTKRKAEQEVQQRPGCEGPRKKLKAGLNGGQGSKIPRVTNKQDDSHDAVDSDLAEITDSSSSRTPSISRVNQSRTGPVADVLTTSRTQAPDREANEGDHRVSQTPESDQMASIAAHAASSPMTEAGQLLPFQPPEGFQKVILKTSPSLHPFQPESNLEGKRLWHITTPASVSFENTKQYNLQDILNGASLVSHEGADYGFQVEPKIPSTSYRLLVPDTNGSSYLSITRSIDQVLHLKQLIRLDSSEKEVTMTEKSRETGRSMRKPIPSQPMCLKTRYKPFGDVSKTTDFLTPKQYIEDSRHLSPAKPVINNNTIDQPLLEDQYHMTNAQNLAHGNHPDRSPDKPPQPSPNAAVKKSKKHKHKTTEKRSHPSASQSQRREEKRKRKGQNPEYSLGSLEEVVSYM